MQRIPDLQYLVRKGREGAAIDPLDPHLQHAVVQTGANGIVAAQLGPVEILFEGQILTLLEGCLLYTSPSPRDVEESRMPSSA